MALSRWRDAAGGARAKSKISRDETTTPKKRVLSSHDESDLPLAPGSAPSLGRSTSSGWQQKSWLRLSIVKCRTTHPPANILNLDACEDAGAALDFS